MGNGRHDEEVEDLAMQARCVNCGREQWALVALAVSRGQAPCSFCGRFSRPMTEAEWRAALTNGREQGWPVDVGF